MKQKRLSRYATGEQHLLAGEGSLQHLGALLQKLAITKTLIICSQRVAQTDYLERLFEDTKQQNLQLETLIMAKTQTTLERVEKEAANRQEHSYDGIIAIGGSALLDWAKALNLALTQPAGNLRQWEGIHTNRHTLLPLIVIPSTLNTLAASSARLYISSSRHTAPLMISLADLLPRVTLLDGELFHTLESENVSYSALATIAIALDSALSPLSNSLSLALVERSLALTFTWALRGSSALVETEARYSLALASHLAGLASNLAPSGAVVALAKSLEAQGSLAFPTAATILSPYLLTYLSHKAPATLERLACYLSRHLAIENATDPLAFLLDQIDLLANELREENSLKLPLRLHDLELSAISGQHYDEIASLALGNGAIIAAPEALEREDLHRLLDAAYWGFALDEATIYRGHQKDKIVENI